MIYDFLEDNWDIVKWVALGIVILEVSEESFTLLRTQNRVLYMEFWVQSVFFFSVLGCYQYEI